jgi:hypothetical protein
VDHVNYWALNESDGLIDLLAIGMLQIESEDRLPASEYVKKGHDMGLFDGYAIDTRGATLTQQTVLQDEISDDDGSPAIILGALWGSPEHTSGFLEPPTAQALSAPGCQDSPAVSHAATGRKGGWMDAAQRHMAYVFFTCAPEHCM